LFFQNGARTEKKSKGLGFSNWTAPKKRFQAGGGTLVTGGERPGKVAPTLNWNSRGGGKRGGDNSKKLPLARQKQRRKPLGRESEGMGYSRTQQKSRNQRARTARHGLRRSHHPEKNMKAGAQIKNLTGEKTAHSKHGKGNDRGQGRREP